MKTKDSFEIVIEPGIANKHYWRDIWHYRELLYILAWRDIKVRYKQTFIGTSWSVIRPLLTTFIFTFVFSRIAGLPSQGNAPYALMVFIGMLPWQFFSNALSESSNSLIGNSNLITKVYFPRIIIPGSSVITSLVDLFISLLILSILMLIYQVAPDWRLIFLPFFIFLVFLLSMGLGLYLTAINVKYRDFRYVIPFIIQIGLYITPVGFSSNVAGDNWRLIMSLNPMVGIIDGFRWCLLGNEMNWTSLYISVFTTLIFLVAGTSYFRKMERYFADNI